MRLARRLLIGVLVALVVAMPTVPATSAQANGHAWWWRPQTGLLGVELPPPPDVPADGLYVEQAPDGASAMAAVRFTLAAGETGPVLELQVATQQGAERAAIDACLTTTRWQDSQAGRWDNAPGSDCEAGRAEGVRSDDGSSWSWDLADLVRSDATIDVVLLAASPSPFRVAFDPPTDASLATVAAREPAPVETGAASSPPPPPPPAVAAAIAPQPLPEATVVAPAAAPEVAPPANTQAPSAPARPAPQPIAAPPLPDDGLPWAAWALLAMIAGLVASDLWSALRDRNAGADRRLGGIGRFARSRTEPPAPLW